MRWIDGLSRRRRRWGMLRKDLSEFFCAGCLWATERHIGTSWGCFCNIAYTTLRVRECQVCPRHAPKLRDCEFLYGSIFIYNIQSDKNMQGKRPFLHKSITYKKSLALKNAFEWHSGNNRVFRPTKHTPRPRTHTTATNMGHTWWSVDY